MWNILGVNAPACVCEERLCSLVEGYFALEQDVDEIGLCVLPLKKGVWLVDYLMERVNSGLSARVTKLAQVWQETHHQLVYVLPGPELTVSILHVVMVLEDTNNGLLLLCLKCFNLELVELTLISLEHVEVLAFQNVMRFALKIFRLDGGLLLVFNHLVQIDYVLLLQLSQRLRDEVKLDAALDNVEEVTSDPIFYEHLLVLFECLQFYQLHKLRQRDKLQT